MSSALNAAFVCLVAILLRTAPASATSKSSFVERVLGRPARTVLDSPTNVEILLLGPADSPPDAYQEFLGRFPVLHTEVLRKKSSDARRLVSVVRGDRSYKEGTLSLCMCEPKYAIRITRSSEIVALVICPDQCARWGLMLLHGDSVSRQEMIEMTREGMKALDDVARLLGDWARQ